MFTSLRTIPPSWWGIAAAALFLVHASCYLYFFVDDEGITLVYARSLLEGRGLTYAAGEGRVEGYSNLLHVIVMTGVLGLVGAAGLHPMWVFVAGGVLSTACGAALVLFVWHLAGRLEVPLLSRTAGAFILALSAPVAVWSNSSLETVPFALAFLLLVAATVPGVRPTAATLAAVVVMLLRVDGALFAFLWIAARFAFGDALARRLLALRVLPALAAAAVVYVAWRVWYFGAWLPLPLQTKVAHKLIGAAATTVWTDRENYLLAFAAQAGWPILFGLAAVPAAMFHSGASRGFVLTAGTTIAALLAYVGVVGDWMFGFRFLVALLAPLALLCAFGLAMVETRARTVARVAAVIAIVIAAVGALRFQQAYRDSQRRPIFWSAPSLDPALRFGEYYEAYRAIEPLVTPGVRIGYHEAGFVPFLLGVENVDMLGLTSRFIGAAPTLDAIFTDVGRYYPLTAEPPHHAVHAYLLRREPSLIVVRKTWMRTVNHGQVPGEILDGCYSLARDTRTFAIYRRTGRAIDPRRVGPSGFLENVAHPAYAARLAVNGAQVAPDAAVIEFPSLGLGTTGHDISVAPAWSLRVDPRDAATVHELYFAGPPPSADVRVEVRLTAASREVLRPLDHVARAGEPLRIQHALDAPVSADTIDIQFTSVTGDPVRLRLQAIRVMGQTPALRDHVERHGIK